MQTLPPPLKPLAAYRQFIVCQFVPKANGKTDKVPVSAHTLGNIDPTNPINWVDADTACTVASSLDGYGVGFVFTEADPFWFLDIDNCFTNDWSSLAKSLMEMLPGAAVEVSQSGTGLHIFGTGTCPLHGCKNIEHGLELYTESRFVALTGTNAIGDASTDASLALPALVNTFFPPPLHLDGSIGWTSEADDDWSGPEDDDVLINKALTAQSVRSRLGHGATFADLWTANEGVLSQHYPHDSNPYDLSSVDAALAQHLAFWTGKNCERMQHLMWQSALVRDKWEREDYLPRTILSALAKQQQVYQAKGSPAALPAAPAPTTEEPAVISADSELTTGHQFLSANQQQDYFKGCVYVRAVHKVWIPDGSLLGPEQFKAHFGGYAFALDSLNEKTTKSAWEAFTLSQAVRFPKVALTCFRPEFSPGEIREEEGLSVVNTYVPVQTESRQGDVTPFLTHMAKLIPNDRDREILMAYIASLIQNPGRKFQWCPLIQGAEGNGKTLVTRVISHCVGHRYTHLPNAAKMAKSGGSNFNSWVEGKLFVSLEDIYVGDKREVTEALKPLITNDRIEIEGKGVDQVTGDNRANWIMYSNHKDALPVTIDARRFCIFYSAQQSKADKVRDGMTGEYFPELYDWLREGGYAACNYFLHHYDIPAEFNPAGSCQEAPNTSSTVEAVEASRGSVEQQILEAIDEERPGFCGGWVSSKALDNLLDDLRVSYRIPIQGRRGILQSLGYDWHPILPKGRVNSVVPQEGAGKPRLYIKREHPALELATSAGVLQRYRKDQGYLDLPATNTIVKQG